MTHSLSSKWRFCGLGSIKIPILHGVCIFAHGVIVIGADKQSTLDANNKTIII